MNNKRQKVMKALGMVAHPVKAYKDAWAKWESSPRYKKAQSDIKNRRGLTY